MKKAYWAGAAVLIGFLALGLSTFSRTMNPYVSFSEAKAAHRTVQVMGALDKGSTKYDTVNHLLLFNMIEEKTKEKIAVAYRDVKPGNFEDAISIVAIGRYEASGIALASTSGATAVGAGVFQAEKLLVKCPSKYQGQEIEKQYGKKS
jgi:cytochrome c-type biogenesis protein CcmE